MSYSHSPIVIVFGAIVGSIIGLAGCQAVKARDAIAPQDVQSPLAGGTHLPIGMNLSSVNDYSPRYPFKNFMCGARPWLTKNANGAGPFNTELADKLPLDAEGYLPALKAAQYHPGMFDVYMKNFALHQEIGCELFMAFSSISKQGTRWGSWGH